MRCMLAICAVFKDEAAYLREWVEFHQLMGVERFYLYNNNSSDRYLDALQPHLASGSVVLHEWPQHPAQLQAYEHCLKTHGNEADWIAFIDVDEFLFSPNAKLLPDVLAAFTQDVMTRSGGFNSINLGDMNTETIAVTNAMMFIGGGSASTAGGIRVTTFLLLAFVIWAELRGEPDVTIRNRRIADETQRQAVTVALLGVALVAMGTLALITLTDHVPFDRALFEATSAFATVGLSTGITPTLPPSAQIMLSILMYVGRVGTIAVGTAIALNTRRRQYRYPEERPLVG